MFKWCVLVVRGRHSVGGGAAEVGPDGVRGGARAVPAGVPLRRRRAARRRGRHAAAGTAGPRRAQQHPPRPATRTAHIGLPSLGTIT